MASGHEPIIVVDSPTCTYPNTAGTMYIAVDWGTVDLPSGATSFQFAYGVCACPTAIMTSLSGAKTPSPVPVFSEAAGLTCALWGTATVNWTNSTASPFTDDPGSTLANGTPTNASQIAVTIAAGAATGLYIITGICDCVVNGTLTQIVLTPCYIQLT